MKIQTLILNLLTFSLISCSSSQKVPFVQKNTPVIFSKVRITDNFWQPRLKTHAAVTLKACINQCENETQRIKNFSIAAGMEQGKFKGFFYDDSDLYKMIEGASYSLMNNPNPELENKLDNIISKIVGAQLKDGYLMTYFILGDLNKRWTDMDKHEMYCCGHLIEAGIAYYNATGKRSLLDVAIKYANHIDSVFGPGKRDWVPGHPEIELALIKLYRVTNENKYLKLANWLLEERGHNKGTWDPADKDYYQDLKPVKELSKISGHAVRAMYLFTGMADLTSITSDTNYIQALDRLWNDVVYTKMYLTGGIGSSRKNEGFTEDYDLPNEEAYCETCASVGMVFWNQRMNMLRGDGKYEDILERSLYNGALAGTSLSGDHFFYVNPLASSGNHHRKPWYGTACCPSQISRLLPSIGNYIYATSNDAVWVNLYIGSETIIPIRGNNIKFIQTTDYPWNGDVQIKIETEQKTPFSVKLRVPGWCKNYSLLVNGKRVNAQNDKQYLLIKRTWKSGDIIQFSMDMPVEVVEADPRVKANIGKRALQRGPIVYCLEECDNPDFVNCRLSKQTTYTSVFNKELLGGVATISATNKDNTYHFVPYYAWDNRKPGKMKVWVDYKE
ncbi:glycoside hydrolase family 127 protein [Bacteroides sedimenti]